MQFETLGDRMKFYEKNFALPRMIPYLPVLIRLDGRAFHSWTRGLERPYDTNLSMLMRECTQFLMEQTGALIGYVQSDEISLLLNQKELDSQIYFDGKRDKINSDLAAQLSVFFNERKKSYAFSEKHLSKIATFDSRTWQVPNQSEAVYYFLWRERDAVKNSISMAAQSAFSHKSLQNLNTNQMQEKLWQEADINWNDYPLWFKRGSYFQKTTVEKPFSPEELDKLPEKHQARQNPDLKVIRREIVELGFKSISSLSNAKEVFFEEAVPEHLTASVT